MLSAAEASCSAGAVDRAQAEVDAAAAALLAAAASLGPVDIRLARDILVEAIVEAQINGRLAPAGTSRTDVARVALDGVDRVPKQRRGRVQAVKLEDCVRV